MRKIINFDKSENKIKSVSCLAQRPIFPNKSRSNQNNAQRHLSIKFDLLPRNAKNPESRIKTIMVDIDNMAAGL